MSGTDDPRVYGGARDLLTAVRPEPRRERRPREEGATGAGRPPEPRGPRPWRGTAEMTSRNKGPQG